MMQDNLCPRCNATLERGAGVMQNGETVTFMSCTDCGWFSRTNTPPTAAAKADWRQYEPLRK